MSARFEGKVVAVTGAAGGIGRALVLRFVSEGARVAAVDLPGAGLEETVAAAKAAGGEAVALPADVSVSDQVAAFVRATTERFGGLDVLCNNAGVQGWCGPAADYPEDVFARVLAVNVTGVWLGMKHAYPALRARGGGAIVNTASTAGLGGAPNFIAYAASKHAVVGLTKTAALEWASAGVRVNAVCPAATQTPMIDSLERGLNPGDPAAVRAAMRASIPLGRYADPAEIAALAAFLASADASFITGGIYTVDGGSKAR